MKPVTMEDILPLEAYEKEREERRRRIIQLKARRRVSLGDRISLVFENRETVIHQIHEMLRAERITDPEAIQHEIDTYNTLLPPPGGLSATLFIELEDLERIREELEKFLGLDRGEHLWMELGGKRRVYARFEEGHSQEDRISSVHYVQFPLEEEDRRLLADPSVEVALVVEHPALSARSPLTQETREELLRDLERD
jgi:hypothetical protein